MLLVANRPSLLLYMEGTYTLHNQIHYPCAKLGGIVPVVTTSFFLESSVINFPLKLLIIMYISKVDSKNYFPTRAHVPTCLIK